jgi:hypothetical protein
VLAEIQHKHARKMQVLIDFIRLCKEEASKKVKQLMVTAPKQKD